MTRHGPQTGSNTRGEGGATRARRRRAPRAAGNARAARQAERRDAILAAALEEFAASGFAATRLDDVARRAGVAKGTIYLYFRDKESLFQELVRASLSPMVGTIETAQIADLRRASSRKPSPTSSCARFSAPAART